MHNTWQTVGFDRVWLVTSESWFFESFQLINSWVDEKHNVIYVNSLVHPTKKKTAGPSHITEPKMVVSIFLGHSQVDSPGNCSMMSRRKNTIYKSPKKNVHCHVRSHPDSQVGNSSDPTTLLRWKVARHEFEELFSLRNHLRICVNSDEHQIN